METKALSQLLFPKKTCFFRRRNTNRCYLNPFGVPSRMNPSQLYETMLGWAGEELGVKYVHQFSMDGKPSELKKN